jgi:hypothetical protein
MLGLDNELFSADGGEDTVATKEANSPFAEIA